MSKRRTSEHLSRGDIAPARDTGVGLEELLARAERAERVVERWLADATPRDVALSDTLESHRKTLREFYIAIGAHAVHAAREGRTVELLRAVDPEEVMASGGVDALPSELAKTLPPEFRVSGMFDTLRPDGHRPSARDTGPLSDARLEPSQRSEEGAAEYAAASDTLSEHTSERLRGGLSPKIASMAEERLLRQQEQLVDLRQWYERMGPTPTDLSAENALSELEHIESFVDEAVDRWGLLDKVRNFQLTAWLTKRLRALQAVLHDDDTALEEHVDRLDVAFRTVSVHSKTTRPGFVFGLALGHEPECGTWLLDAIEREGNIRQELGLDEPKTPDAEPPA